MAYLICADKFLWNTLSIAKAKKLVKEGKVEIFALYPDGGEASIGASPTTYIMDAENDRSVKLAVEVGYPTNMCKVRADLTAQGLAPMVKVGGKLMPYQSAELCDCFQPDELDGEEFNLLVVVKGKLVRASSIDFEFVAKVA